MKVCLLIKPLQTEVQTVCMWGKKSPCKALQRGQITRQTNDQTVLDPCPKLNVAEKTLMDKYYKDLKKKLAQVPLGLVQPIFYGLRNSLNIKPDTFDKHI